MYARVPHTQRACRGQRGRQMNLTGSHEPPYGYWELNLHPLECSDNAPNH